VAVMSDDEEHELSPEQFKYFADQVKYWCHYFGVSDWYVQIDTEAAADNFGECSGELEDRNAAVSVAMNWERSPDDLELSGIAFHEVCELMLRDIALLGAERFVSWRELETARHRVIQMLHNSVWREKMKPQKEDPLGN